MNILSKRTNDDRPLQTHLKAIWHVDETSKYNVLRTMALHCTHVAVCTTDGSGELYYQTGEHYLLPKNSVLFLEAEKITRYTAGPDGWQFYWFEFDTLSHAFPWANTLKKYYVSPQDRALMEQCFLFLNSASAYEVMMADSIFHYLISNWLLLSDRTSKSRNAYLQITTVLEKGRSQQMTVAEMAKALGMSERAFRQAVQRITGLSPKAYIIKGEMLAAKELLCTTDLTVGEIAERLHFTNPFYFSRIFKKVYGVSPQQMRSQVQP